MYPVTDPEQVLFGPEKISKKYRVHIQRVGDINKQTGVFNRFHSSAFFCFLDVGFYQSTLKKSCIYIQV